MEKKSILIIYLPVSTVFYIMHLISLDIT